jgi:hypothetical protein
MAAIVGSSGSVTFPSSLGGLLARTWNATFTRTAVDITAFGNFGRNRTPGLFDITGSITGTLDSASAASPLAWVTNGAATVTLLAESGNSFLFNANIESANVAVDVAAGADITYNFGLASTGTNFAGACTVAWS